MYKTAFFFRKEKKLQLATVGHNNFLGSLSRLRAERLDPLEHVHALDHRPEHHMPIVQPGRLHRRNEELGAVGVGPRVRHREDAGRRVLQREVLIGELVAVDRLATGAVVVGEVAPLTHEVGDDTMERRPLVPETLLAGAQGAEVLRSLGDDVIAKLQNNMTQQCRRRRGQH